jgi:serine/threonine-protein kinase
MAAFAIGQTINDSFQVTGVLAKSRTGVIYACQTDDEPPQTVAVKVVDPRDGERSPEAGNLFMDLTVVTMLEHPHLVRIIEAQEIDFADPYIAMELLSGEDLEARIRARSGLGRAELWRVLEPVCSVASAIHGEGLIHGALKPSNVFLVSPGEEGGEERVKVLDPAIYHVQRATVAPRQPATIGYLPYLAPEQAAGQPDWIGPTTDVYLLGLLCFVGLTGKQPFVSSNPAGLVEQIRHEPPRTLAEAGLKDPPGELQAVLTRALVKTPGHRYQTVEALFDELRQALSAARAGEPDPPPLSPLRPRKSRPRRPEPEAKAPRDRPAGDNKLWDLSDLHLSRLPPPIEYEPAPEPDKTTAPPEVDERKTVILPEVDQRKTVALPGEDSGPAPGAEDLHETAVEVIRAPGTGEPMEVIIQSDSGQPAEEPWDPEATVRDENPPDMDD